MDKVAYISTRGGAPALDFEQVLLTGLAPDGGLYVPDRLPVFSPDEIAAMASLSYPELAHRIIAPFVAGTIPGDDLARLVTETYAEFRHPAVAPLVQLQANQWVLELFHGPTLAFKDFALQLLGRLLDYVLERRQQKVVIMGATSGIRVLQRLRAAATAATLISLSCTPTSGSPKSSVAR